MQSCLLQKVGLQNTLKHSFLPLYRMDSERDWLSERFLRDAESRTISAIEFRDEDRDISARVRTQVHVAGNPVDGETAGILNT